MSSALEISKLFGILIEFRIMGLASVILPIDQSSPRPAYEHTTKSSTKPINNFCR